MEIGINLIQVACFIYMLLGFVHAFLTLFTKAMEPTSSEVLALNKTSHSFITAKTTLWLGGIGFHLSHSLGLFVFGAFYFALSVEYPEIIWTSKFFSAALIIVPLSYVFLSIKYWFILPSLGLGLASIFCITGLVYINS
tara:strand:- start:12884 stop:13300 length:417 start_codon:yes stop_codon:yes gene_type:complete